MGEEENKGGRRGGKNDTVSGKEGWREAVSGGGRD